MRVANREALCQFLQNLVHDKKTLDFINGSEVGAQEIQQKLQELELESKGTGDEEIQNGSPVKRGNEKYRICMSENGSSMSSPTKSPMKSLIGRAHNQIQLNHMLGLKVFPLNGRT